MTWLFMVLTALAPGVTTASAAAPLTVSAAISLTEALEEVGRAFAAQGGTAVRFNFSGSNVLARQIVNGAPSDLFVSADEAQMDFAQAAGAVIGSTRVALLGNRLAVLVADRLSAAVSDVKSLTRPEIRRIALGDPAAVPAGVYARGYLQAAGVWDAVRPKVVPMLNVRAALTALENGAADVAIVYESDTLQARRARVAFIVTGADAPRIVYPAAIVASSKQRAEAERFLAFLRSAAASDVFSRYRFIPLAATGGTVRLVLRPSSVESRVQR